MSLTGSQYQQILHAVSAAFDDAGLRQLARQELDADLDAVAGGENKTEVVFNLIAWAVRDGRIADLITGALHQNPDNPDLQSLAKSSKSWHIEAPAPADESPYNGLAFYDVYDAPLFFGREKLTAELVEYLKDHRFLAVVGASGSGKSSVVRAGVLPALQRGEIIKGSDAWAVHVVTPTATPLKTLSLQLLLPGEAEGDVSRFMAALRESQDSLHLCIRRMLMATNQRHMVLVVDQFEELFTLCKDRSEQQAYIDNLLTACAPQGDTTVILTLRADFYARCAEFANLRLALQDWQKYIGPMSHEELRDAIEKPAAQNGWDFEPGLVDAILDDVEGEAGALPLLSHAMLETWKRRSGRTLTFAGYHAAGGVQGVIAKTADVVYAELSPDQKAIARNIFLRLTALGEGVQDTRRRVRLSELPSRADVKDVLQRLEDARLVTVVGEWDSDAAQLVMFVDVTHEALIREWPQLREWVAEDRAGLRLHRKLAEAAAEWAELYRDPGALYRGVRLQMAQEWATTHGADLNDLEREFLDISQEQAEAEQRDREEARQRELEQAQALAAEAQARLQAEKQHGQSSLPAVWLYIADGNEQSQMNLLQQQDRVTWAANQNTRAGDLILTYRSAPYSDIAYLFRAQTDPKRSSTLVIWRRHYTIELGEKLTLVRPVNLAELRNHPQLKDWSLTGTPQGAMQRKEDIRAEGYWEPLRSLLVARNPAIAEPLARWENLASEKILADALSVAFETPSDTAQGVAVLAPHLSRELLTQALKGTLAIKTEEMRAQVLTALAPYLSSGLLQEGLIAARNIQGEAYRAEVLAAFALHLPKGMQRVQVLEEALASAEAIENKGKRNEAVSTLVEPLIECLHDENLVIRRTAALALAKMPDDGRAVTAVRDFLRQKERKARDFIYDVFVSYSHADETWVQGRLLPRLRENGLRVIEFRDFEIGVPLAVNIEHAIDLSRNVLLVLTPDWVSSEWTELEYLDSLEPSIRGQRHVVPLMLRECDPPGLLALLAYTDFTDPDLQEQEWQRLIDSLERAASNPFTSIQAIHDPEHFIGRVPLLERLNRQLQSSSVALIGERKIGKTSLLHRLADILRSEKDQVVVYWDFSGGENITDLLAEVTSALGGSGNSWDDLQLAVRGRRIVLLLDEFDVARKYGFSREIYHNFRALCGSGDGLRLVTASRRAPREIFFEPDLASPPWNFMHHEEIGPLTHDEAQLLLNHPWSAEALSFDQSICDELIKLSDYHPFWLQRAAYHRYEALSNPSYDWRVLYERDMAVFQSDVEWLERLSPAASNAICWAEGLRQATGADALYTEYLVAGLYQDAAGPLSLLLTMTDEDATIRSKLDSLVNNMTSTNVRMEGVHPVAESGLRNVPLSPNSQKVLTETLRLADRATAYFVSPQYLLAGLLAVPDAVATNWITNLLSVDREALYHLIAEAPDGQMPLDDISKLLPPQVPTYQLHYQVQPQGELAVGESLHLELVLQPSPLGDDAFLLPAQVRELYCFITTEGLSVLDTNVATMHRHPQTDHPMPARFELRADFAGQSRWQVQFFGEDPNSGYTQPLHKSQWIPVTVNEGAERLPVLPVLDLRAAPQPHIMLQVKVDVQGSKVAGRRRTYVLSYYLTSRLPLGEPPLRGGLVGAVELDETDLMRMQALLADALSQAGGQPEEVREQLLSLGAYFFDLLFPKEEATAFRAALARIETYDKSRTSGQRLTWLVLEEGLSEVWMPWEMLVSHALSKREDEDEAWWFLGEQYYLSRWVTGLGTPLYGEVPWGELGLADHVYATPDDPEGRAWQCLLRPQVSEKAVTRLFNVPTGGEKDDRLLYGLHVLQRADQLVGQRSLVPLPGNQANGARPASNTQEEAVIDIRASIRRQRPVVGLSILAAPGQQSPSGGLLPGIALSYLRAGASAVVGPWWPTTARADRIFWASFYHLLESRVPLGEAVWRARQEVHRAEPKQPDWLAYTLFGDPRAQPYLPAESEGYTALACLNLEADGSMRPQKAYYFQASISTRPPIWHEQRLVQTEALPQRPNAVFLAPDLQESIPDPTPMTREGRYLVQATATFTPQTEGEFYLIVRLQDGNERLQSLQLTLPVRSQLMEGIS